MNIFKQRVKSFDAADNICDDLIGQVGEHILDKELAKRQRPYIKATIKEHAVNFTTKNTPAH